MALRLHIPAGYTMVADKTELRRVLRGAGSEKVARARALVRAGAATRKRAATRQSVAGKPPVSRTGKLVRSMRVRVWKSGEGVSVVNFAESARGSHAPYALFLEKGTQGGIASGRKDVKGRRNQWKRINRKNTRVAVIGNRRVEPRPFMQPALDQTVANGLAERVRDAVVSGMKFRRGGKMPIP